MKITGIINVPFELKILNKPIFYKDIQIGKIIKSYFKNNQICVDIKINTKKKNIIYKIFNLAKKI